LDDTLLRIISILQSQCKLSETMIRMRHYWHIRIFTVNTSEETCLEAFEMKGLRKILRVS